MPLPSFFKTFGLVVTKYAQMSMEKLHDLEDSKLKINIMAEDIASLILQVLAMSNNFLCHVNQSSLLHVHDLLSINLHFLKFFFYSIISS